MVEVNFSELAYEDLLLIEDYISKDSPTLARNFISKIFDRVEILKTFPKSGRKVPEFNEENLRELISGNYRIVYRIYSMQEIVILRVIHGASLLYLDSPSLQTL